MAGFWAFKHFLMTQGVSWACFYLNTPSGFIGCLYLHNYKLKIAVNRNYYIIHCMQSCDTIENFWLSAVVMSAVCLRQVPPLWLNAGVKLLYWLLGGAGRGVASSKEGMSESKGPGSWGSLSHRHGEKIPTILFSMQGNPARISTF